MYKFNFIKIKNVCSLKDSYKNKKAKHRLEKILATHISIKDFYPEYLRNFCNSIIRQNLKETKDKRFITKGIYLWIANKYIKRCTTSLFTKGIKIKMSLRYHHTHTRIAKI